MNAQQEQITTKRFSPHAILVFCLILIFNVYISYGQESNPLFSSSPTVTDTINAENTHPIKSENSIQKQQRKAISIPIINKFIKENARLQKEIKTKFFLLSNNYKTKKSVKAILLIFMFSFLYGILHSLGPGHGKVFVFSYILTAKPKVMKAIGTSYLIATVHALSGMVVALIIYFTLNTYSSSSATVSDASNIVVRFGFAILALLGIVLFIRNLIGKGHHKHSTLPANENKRLVPFILSIGLVPCPGTIIIVTFLASMGLLGIGIASVFFIIMGMGITISVIGLISLFSKKLVLRLFQSNSHTYEKTYRYFTLLGALLLILFGTWFFIGSFYC